MNVTKIKIVIHTKNAAFEGINGPHETARILRDLAHLIEAGAWSEWTYIPYDANGNKVGYCDLCK